MLAYFKKFKFFIRILIYSSFNFWFDLISILIIFRSVRNISKNFNQQKTIGIISDCYLPRIEKIAYGLSKSGYNIILFCKDSKHFSKTFSQIFTYRSPMKAHWLAKQFKPMVYHIFSSWNFDTSYSIIKNKQHLPLIIFDDYDVMAGMVFNEFAKKRYPGQLRKERMCLENADGLCCRSLETQYAKRYLNYNYKAKRIFFPEYIWSQPLKNNSESSVNKKTLLYIGNIDQSLTTIVLSLKTIGWTLDIYPAHIVKTDKFSFPDNVIVHKTINPKDLIFTISQYNVAIQFPSKIISQNKKIYTIHKDYYSASGKVFDYIEAGLKVLISDEIHQKWLLKRYGAAIEIDELNPLEDIVKKLSTFDIHDATENKTFVSTDYLNIEKQITRLIVFYNNLTE